MSKLKSRFRRPSPTEQHVLEHLTVQLVVNPAEQERLDQLIVEHHYLHSVSLVGEHLRYVVKYKGEWLALATWSAAALHLKARDHFIGWSEEQRRKRLPLRVCPAGILTIDAPIAVPYAFSITSNTLETPPA